MTIKQPLTPEGLRLLLDADADPNILNIYGDSPLDWAELEHSEEVIQCLRDAGAKHGEEQPHKTNESDMESEYSGIFGRSE